VIVAENGNEGNGRKTYYYPTGKDGELAGIKVGDMVIQDDGQVQTVGWDGHLYRVEVEG
jgi:hypothetical protein